MPSETTKFSESGIGLVSDKTSASWRPRVVSAIAGGVLVSLVVALFLTNGRSASSAWTPLPVGGPYESDRGFALSSPEGWFIIEPLRPHDSALVAVLSTGETEWQNGADQQLPIVYVLQHAQSIDPATVALLYPQYAWTPKEVDGVDLVTAEWEPDDSSTWGGRIWLIPNGQDVWELRAFVPDGPGYESAQENVEYILDGFGLEASG